VDEVEPGGRGHVGHGAATGPLSGSEAVGQRLEDRAQIVHDDRRGDTADRDQPPAGAESTGSLGKCGFEIAHVVQHPNEGDGVGRAVVHRQ
jgi:hypothetical protein